MTRATQLFFILLGTALLTACGGGGGGGGGGSSVTPPPSGGGGSGSGGWVAGVFAAASSFKDKCQAPRSGTDIEGNAFTDTAGTSTDEKNWLRSWTRETYLWNTEVPDSNPAAGGTRLNYFAGLKTFAKTASGKDKDDFHFSEPTADYLQRRNSAASASYGAEFVIVAGTIPREVRVVYTEPDSPAEVMVGGRRKLARGAEILSVDGVDLVNGGATQAEVDVINAGLFPQTAGRTTTLVVRDTDGGTRTVSLTSQNLVAKPVNRTRILTGEGGEKVGYILFNTFSPYSSERDIADAIQTMKAAAVTELVLDLRYNGGGLLAVASELGYMIAGDIRTSGRTFESLRFNAAAGSRNPVTGEINNPVPFLNSGQGFSISDGTPLPALNLARVFVLTTGSTCSASEAVINGLRGVGVEVIQVGGRTCGKPYGFYPQDNCGETYYSIQFQGVNNIGFGDYADGFLPANSTSTVGVKIPGCVVGDDYAHELGERDEGLVSTALSYGANGVCPARTMVASAASARRNAIPSPELAPPLRSIMATNRDMTMRR